MKVLSAKHRVMPISIRIGKPKVIIEEHFTVGFNPDRAIWGLLIYNAKLSDFWGMIFKRQEIDCWIEANFIVNAEIPSIGDKAAATSWGYEPPNYLTLKPNSNPYRIELISKIRGELGFHIKRPDADTLMTAEEVLAIITVRTGKDETIVAKAIFAIFDKGRHDWDWYFERLE